MQAWLHNPRTKKACAPHSHTVDRSCRFMHTTLVQKIFTQSWWCPPCTSFTIDLPPSWSICHLQIPSLAYSPTNLTQAGLLLTQNPVVSVVAREHRHCPTLTLRMTLLVCVQAGLAHIADQLLDTSRLQPWERSNPWIHQLVPRLYLLSIDSMPGNNLITVTVTEEQSIHSAN